LRGAVMGALKLPPKEEALVASFVKKLGKIYRDGLVSAILYGSAASGEFTGKHSNINLLIVLKDTGLKELDRSYGLVNARAFKIISPIFFTEECMKASTDTFPIEFFDMKENYAMLYGRDVLKGLGIDTRNLRFQCEHELRSKLILIKRRYLTARNRAQAEELLFRSFTSCLHIMRNVLRLKGKAPSYAKDMIIGEIEKELGVDTRVFSEILWAKNKGMRLGDREIEALLGGFVGELESIVEKVDKL